MEMKKSEILDFSSLERPKHFIFGIIEFFKSNTIFENVSFAYLVW